MTHATDPPATPAPTVRHAVAQYVEHLTPGTPADKLQVVGAALAALLQPAMEERVDTLTPMRLLVLGGELKSRVSPKTGRPLAASTFRRYVLAAQEFYAWAAQKWPRPAKQPGQPAATQEPGSGQHLGDLIRILRTDAGLTRQQLGEATKLGEVLIKRVETRRQRLTRRQLDRLTSVQAMAGLLDWAAREVAAIDLAPEEDGGTSPREDDGDKEGSGGGEGGGT